MRLWLAGSGLERRTRVRLFDGKTGGDGVAPSCLLVGPVWDAPAPDPITFGYAVERGDLRTVKRWLDDGLNPEYQAAQIGTGLMVAAWYGNIEMMALFVERGADAAQQPQRRAALQLAAWGGHLDASQVAPGAWSAAGA
jgi:hypothetical protein